MTTESVTQIKNLLEDEGISSEIILPKIVKIVDDSLAQVLLSSLKFGELLKAVNLKIVRSGV
jgi:hypothetical protein